MEYTVTISGQAKEDIANIYSYILNTLQSQINADAVLNRLEKEISDLTFMAESYHLYPNEPWKSLGIHYFSVNNYSIFYTIEKDFANVIHVTYGRRDLDKVLSDYEKIS